MKENDEARPDYFVQSLERGLSVIRTFSKDVPHQTLSDVAEATGLTRAAARRFLLTLSDLGYVRSAGREFYLTPKVLELGYAYLASSTLAEFVQPHLVQLVENLADLSDVAAFEAGVAIFDGDDIVYVAQARVAGLLQLNISTGSRFPAYVTSTGRILLAGAEVADVDAYLKRVSLERFTKRTVQTKRALREAIDEVRRQGWAVLDREYEDWLRGFSVPIAGRDGGVVAALGISTHADGDDETKVREVLLPMLQAAARDIERDLKMVQASPPTAFRSAGPAS